MFRGPSNRGGTFFRGGGRGGRGGRGGQSFGPRGGAHEDLGEENYNGGEVYQHREHNEEEDYRPGPHWPTRPLTRVMARAHTASESNKYQDDGQPEAQSAQHAPGFENAYRLEVNEFIPRNGQPGSTIPCVTVRDMRTFIPERQRRAYIPVALAEELAQCLRQCRQHPDKGQYDVTKLPTRTFQCPVSKKKVEIERVTEPSGRVSTRLRTYMDVPSKEQFKPNDFVEVIELRNDLMNHLLKFLDDVAIRYRPLDPAMTVPSLYSYSGERRFYFDLRETRWGVRMHVSQVTGMHRNVVAVPLESLVSFRDRLNQAIHMLELEKKPTATPARRSKGNRTTSETAENKDAGAGDNAGSARPPRTNSGGRGRGRGGRGRGNRRGGGPRGANGEGQRNNETKEAAKGDHEQAHNNEPPAAAAANATEE